MADIWGETKNLVLYYIFHRRSLHIGSVWTRNALKKLSIFFFTSQALQKALILEENNTTSFKVALFSPTSEHRAPWIHWTRRHDVCYCTILLHTFGYYTLSKYKSQKNELLILLPLLYFNFQGLEMTSSCFCWSIFRLPYQMNSILVFNLGSKKSSDAIASILLI